VLSGACGFWSSGTLTGLSFSRMKQSWVYLKTLLFGDNRQAPLKQRALGSSMWVVGGFGFQKLLQFCSNLILTRLLFPEAFGLMALAMVFLVGLQMFSDIGIRPAIIREKDGNDPAFLNTAWTIQLIRGLGICVAGMLIAYPVSLLYNEPVLFPILALLSTTAAIAGFTPVTMITAERDLNFRTLTVVQLTGQLVSILLLVTLAYLWRSVWALVAANIAGSLVAVAIGFVAMRGHRHRFLIDRGRANKMIVFGKWIFLSTIATYLGGEGLRAIQAGFLSRAEFGVLSIAYMMSSIPTDLMIRLSNSIGMPVVAESFRTDPAKASAVLSRFRVGMLAASALIFGVLVFGSAHIVELLYDRRYHDAGRYLALLSLSNAVSIIGSGYLSAILAIGKSRDYFSVMLVTAIYRIIAIIIGYGVNGIEGMIIGLGFANLFVLASIYIVVRKINIIDYKVDAFALIIFGLVGILYFVSH
jgi:O-antigen/teichoic acid export membrane protein